MLGGLIVAMVGTLVIVPSVLGVMIDLRERIARRLRGTAPAVARTGSKPD